jgi:hypothetical protein
MGSSTMDALPGWLVVLLSAAALVLIAACFASGVCEAAAIFGAVGAGLAAVVIGILRASGVTVNGDGDGGTASADGSADSGDGSGDTGDGSDQTQVASQDVDTSSSGDSSGESDEDSESA